MACDEIGTYAGVRQDFAEFALQHDPDGTCQNVRIGPDSPGPVDDVEVLARFVACPAHVARVGDTYGEVDESLFADTTSIGCSVSRLLNPAGELTADLHARGEALAAEIRAGANGRAPQPDRHYLGAVKLAAREVRALRVDEIARRVRVYDTSRGAIDPLHGDIVMNGNGLNKALRKQLRVQLYMLAVNSGLFVAPQYAGAYDIARCGLQLHRA
jgi:hypothetical protein